MPEISVIVPVYNSGKYLKRCIESILAQSFKDFELILVDDGSTDSSSEICDEYQSKYNRIKVYHQKNQGVSSARNRGIKNANGNWITFIDSDDYVNERLLDTLFESQKKYCCEFVLTGQKKINGRDCQKREYPDLFLKREDFGVIFDKNLMRFQKAPWAKLFKTDILKSNSILFDEKIHAGEDALFVYTYLLKIRSLSFTPGCGYIYDLHQGSLTTLGIASFDEEMHGFIKFRAVVEKLMSNIQTSSTYPMEYLNYWQERVIASIYSNEFKTRKERITKLKGVDTHLLKKWKRNSSWKEYLLNKMLISHLYYLYDLLMTLKR